MVGYLERMKSTKTVPKIPGVWTEELCHGHQLRVILPTCAVNPQSWSFMLWPSTNEEVAHTELLSWYSCFALS